MSALTVTRAEFIAWNGDYEKMFYLVLPPNQRKATWCWPNGGRMLAVDGSGRGWSYKRGCRILVMPRPDGMDRASYKAVEVSS